MVSSRERADSRLSGKANLALFFGLVNTSCMGLIGPTVAFDALPMEESVL